jgi:hypothetical protein
MLMPFPWACFFTFTVSLHASLPQLTVSIPQCRQLPYPLRLQSPQPRQANPRTLQSIHCATRTGRVSRLTNMETEGYWQSPRTEYEGWYYTCRRLSFEGPGDGCLLLPTLLINQQQALCPSLLCKPRADTTIPLMMEKLKQLAVQPSTNNHISGLRNGGNSWLLTNS